MKKKDAAQIAVGVLERVEIVHVPALADQIAGEGDRLAVDLGQERTRAEVLPFAGRRRNGTSRQVDS